MPSGRDRRSGRGLTRISAVDGAAWSETERAGYQGSGGSRPLNPGEIGCWLSHRRAWAAILQTGAAWGVVLEDDAHLCAAFDSFVQQPGPPADADIVKLDTCAQRKIRLSRRSIVWAGRLRAACRARRSTPPAISFPARPASGCWPSLERFVVPVDLALFGSAGLARCPPARPGGGDPGPTTSLGARPAGRLSDHGRNAGPGSTAGENLAPARRAS